MTTDVDELYEWCVKKRDHAFIQSCRHDRECCGDEEYWKPEHRFFLNAYCNQMTAFGEVINKIDEIRNQNHEKKS
jgi:hypothetical protein